MERPKKICISHGEDMDGLICASILLRLKGAKPILVTYDDFLEVLKDIKPPLEELFVCDLNMREALVKEFLRINGFACVNIFDHHPTPDFLFQELKAAGINIIHSTLDCASVLLYNHFRKELGREAGRIAAYAAWSDQFDEGPIARRILREYDRQLVQHEALILTHSLARDPSRKFKSILIDNLKMLVYPHLIEGVPEAAIEHLEKTRKTLETLEKKAHRKGVIAYVAAPRGKSIGMLANLVIDALGVDVGLSYKFKGEELANISLRSKRGFSFHLGEITREIAIKNDGFGGGHKRASGASVPQNKLINFIEEIERELSKFISE